MAGLGAMQKALVESGLAKPPKERKHHPKTFTCRKCGEAMSVCPGTNVMACKCGNYFIFSAR